ncbi:MAG: AEC family transporter [Clostridia bacterium]|nr:AEC family transporter [Clostridia bacterium]
MDSLIFALSAVMPLVALVAIGYLLKRIGFMSEGFAKTANKLVFHAFLPVTLFLNVYRIENLAEISFSYIYYVVAVVVAVFLVAIPLSVGIARERSRRGVLIQVAFRSNFALVGLPLAGSLFGAEGEAVATLLSAIVIPIFNVLAVIALSIFRDDGGKPSVKKILLGIAKNPLIISIFAGLACVGVRALFAQLGWGFRLSDIKPLFTVLDYLSDLSTPLVLLVLGAQFEFSAVKALRREVIFGTLMRALIVPLLGIGIAYLCFKHRFTGAHFAAIVAVFATPVAVSSVPMAQEMDNDVALAGQLMVWTTLCSALTIFLASFLLRLAGIFA